MEFEIDGKKVNAEQGMMIIEAADDAGIHIPRFCYHKKLSIAANCRMCLVEVEKSGKSLPACATPVTDGMKVFTCSDIAREAQEIVMEFLLINHPLDCPICDQGGQCELQDVAMGFGSDISRYTEGKRSVSDENLGSLISTDMTRCIHCTRCVRFGEEVAGLRELGATGRGEYMKIGTYIGKSIRSEMSGNIIDLCPVGALTSKPFRFTARAWELQQHEGISPHDCIGSHLHVHTRQQQVMRVVPRENESINECWLSDRDRFSYEGVHSPDRLKHPLIKRDGKWYSIDWKSALDYTVNALANISHQHGSTQIGALASPSSTIEELYLLQKFMRGIGTENIDHRLRQADVSDQHAFPVCPSLGMKIDDIERVDTILLVGCDVHREQPILGHQVRKAFLNHAKVMSIAPYDIECHFDLEERILSQPMSFATDLAAIAKILVEKNPSAVTEEAVKCLQDVKDVSIAAKKIADTLLEGKQILLLLGALLDHHPQAAILRAIAQLIAQLSHAKFGLLSDGANSAGAYLAGVLPHRGPGASAIDAEGLSAEGMISLGLKAYVLINIDPDIDCANPSKMMNSLAESDFVVSLSPFSNDAVNKYANVILPISTYAETSGSYVNIEGQWQSFRAAISPKGESRPAWKVFRVLGNLAKVAGFDYNSVDEVLEEVKSKVNEMPERNPAWFVPEELERKSSALTRITAWPMYGVDNVVRRASSLQQSAANNVAAIFINEQLADRLGFKPNQVVTAKQDDGHAELPIAIDNRVPDDAVLIFASYETRHLGESFAGIELTP